MGEAPDDTSGKQGNQGNEGNGGGQIDDQAIEALRLTNQNLEKQLADQRKAAAENTRKLAELERKSLEGSGDFRKLYEDERKLREEAQTKAERLSTGFILAAKQSAGREALRKAGMNEEGIRLVSTQQFDSLAADVDDSSGEIKVSGADTFVDDFKKKFPTLFGKPAPRVNPGGGSASDVDLDGKQITAMDYLAIEKKHGPRSKEASDAWAKLQEQKKKQNSR